MPTYKVTAPDGHVVTFDGPAGMSQSDVVTRAKQERGFDEGTIATEPSAWQRFSSGLLSTIPKPTDVLNAFMHPIDTARAYALNQIQHPMDAAIDSAFPLAPGASQAAHAGQHMAEGNIAGGMGELAGILAPEVLPEVPGAVLGGARVAGRGVSAAGRGLEVAGQATKKASPLLAMTDAIVSHSPMQGAAIAAAPYAAEYGGRGLQKLGKAMQGLGVDTPEMAGEVQRFLPNRSRVSREVPGSSYPAPPAPSEPLPTSSLADVDPYMPNISSADRPMPTSVQTSRIPYNGTEPNTPTSPVGRLAGKSPSLNDELTGVLQSLGDDSTPVTAQSGKLADTPAVRSIDRGNMIGGETADLLAADEQGRQLAAQFPWDDDPHGIEAARDRVAARQYQTSRDVMNRHFPSPEAEDFIVSRPDPGLEGMSIPDSWKPFVAKNPAPVVPASADVPMTASMPVDRLHRILSAFENPETATPFDKDLLDLILQDPNGGEFVKPYGPSGAR